MAPVAASLSAVLHVGFVAVALEAEEELNDPDEAAREAGADGEDVAKGDRVCARTDVIEGVQHAVRHGRTHGSVPTRTH